MDVTGCVRHPHKREEPDARRRKAQIGVKVQSSKGLRGDAAGMTRECASRRITNAECDRNMTIPLSQTLQSPKLGECIIPKEIRHIRN